MELMYIALLLHKVGKKINEENIKKVADAVGIKVDGAKMKALVASLDGINIEKTIKEASIPTVTAVAEVKEEKKEKPKEEERKSEEQAAAGLSSLFG